MNGTREKIDNLKKILLKLTNGIIWFNHPSIIKHHKSMQVSNDSLGCIFTLHSIKIMYIYLILILFDLSALVHSIASIDLSILVGISAPSEFVHPP